MSCISCTFGVSCGKSPDSHGRLWRLDVVLDGMWVVIDRVMNNLRDDQFSSI